MNRIFKTFPAIAALSMLPCAAMADASFLGVIDTVPYNPNAEIYLSTSGAPGAYEHGNSVSLPSGGDAGAQAYGNLKTGVLQATAESAAGYSMAGSTLLLDLLSISGTGTPTISFDMNAYIRGADVAGSVTALTRLVFKAVDSGGHTLSQQTFLLQDRGCELFAPSADRVCQNAPDPGFYDLSGSFVVPRPANGIVALAISLTAQAVEGAVADAGHSVALRMNLPQGVLVTSQSGVFLADVTGAVPEPASVALWLGGLLAVGGVARRRAARR